MQCHANSSGVLASHLALDASCPLPRPGLSGALDDVEAAFGMHVMPHIKTGLLATRSGTIMAGALSFQVEVDSVPTAAP